MSQTHTTPDSELRSELGAPALNGWAFDPWTALRAPRPAPAALEELDDAVQLRVELPGVDPELISVDVAGEILTISVQAAPADGEQPAHRFGAFRQRLRLPCAVDASSAVANTRLGVLTVRLAKPEEQLPRRISVQAG